MWQQVQEQELDLRCLKSPFVADLMRCFAASSDKNELLRLLAIDLKKQISKRLMVASISTKNIFFFYIYLVELLHLIDVKNELEPFVCAPIKTLLKSRSFSIKIAIELINKTESLYQKLG